MSEKILVVAGHTEVFLDKVRKLSVFDSIGQPTVLTNIFNGKTGRDIALHLSMFYNVTLLTSNPFCNIEKEIGKNKKNKIISKLHFTEDFGIKLKTYKTFDELITQMEYEVKHGNYYMIVFSPAVSDYGVDKIFSLDNDNKIIDINPDSGKIPSSYDNLNLGLIKNPKIINLIKNEWNYTGILVKFKLEVNISNDELIKIMRKSIEVCKSDYIVGNCLDWMNETAIIMSRETKEVKVISRNNLPEEIFEIISYKEITSRNRSNCY